MPEKLALAILLTCSLYLTYRSTSSVEMLPHPAMIGSSVPSQSVSEPASVYFFPDF